jgi:hypothetical protein
MVRHIVFWKVKEEALGVGKAENMRRIKDRLESLRGRIPGLLRIEVGIDFSRTPQSFDVALFTEFESRQALDGYQAHPEHEAVRQFVAQVVSERAIADYE